MRAVEARQYLRQRLGFKLWIKGIKIFAITRAQTRDAL